MNFYIDFEATQPEQEIISIGATADTGATFYSLVKPSFSSLTPYVSNLIHLTNEDLTNAPSLDEALCNLNLWIFRQEADLMKCNFFAYGDDNKFIQASLSAITNSTAYVTAAILLTKIQDCSKDIRKFFHGSIKLVHAYNYINETMCEQMHNPLVDATMLKQVHQFTQNNEPLAQHPMAETNKPLVMQNLPTGKFYCKGTGKHAVEREFENIEAAMDWLINSVIHSKNPEEVRRDKMALKIMKAIRGNNIYCGYKWRRVKKGVN